MAHFGASSSVLRVPAGAPSPLAVGQDIRSCSTVAAHSRGSGAGVYPASFLGRLGNENDQLGCHFWITFGPQMDYKMIHHTPRDPLECAAPLPIWANTSSLKA